MCWHNYIKSKSSRLKCIQVARPHMLIITHTYQLVMYRLTPHQYTHHIFLQIGLKTAGRWRKNEVRFHIQYSTFIVNSVLKNTDEGIKAVLYVFFWCSFCYTVIIPLIAVVINPLPTQNSIIIIVFSTMRWERSQYFFVRHHATNY